MAKIKTRARAVDMLGRQQIAGTQNAISEIFKNAHDAYATCVKVDYFEEDSTIVIRDDGLGMTLDDFENKWLVLGTESKTGENRKSQYRPQGRKERPITGEKGIGRLAIALLGRQVLILTRAKRKEGLHDLVVSLVHWSLFEIPGLNLDEIEIPVMTIPNGRLPSPKQVLELKAELSKALRSLEKRYKGVDFNDIHSDLDSFEPDLDNLDDFLSDPDAVSLSLKGDGHGTHFIIAPANPILDIELAVEEKNQDWSFRKQLLGFSDTVFGSSEGEQFETSFKRWSPGAVAGDEMLDPSTFFTSDELERSSDHLLKGRVDEFGQFKGSLRVYEERYDDVIVPWNNRTGTPTECGEFQVVFGYLMGRPVESMLEGEQYARLSQKLDKVGGIYVYRDSIRVLPYGDFSVDWLEVEKRRSKGAGYYFWSYRRMFGAVLLSREHNLLLQEKAGREGFQQNRAYRELREILMNLLQGLVAEFFREGNTKGDVFEKTQAEMRKRAEALARQQKRSREKRKNFTKKLQMFFESTSAGNPEKAVEGLRAATRKKMEAATRIVDRDKAAAALIRAERDAIADLNATREQYTCKRPAGIALTRELTREWDGYRLEKERLDSQVFGPYEEEIARTLGEVAKKARLFVDQRKRLEQRLAALVDERQRQLKNAVGLTRDTASEARKTVFDITQKAMLALDSKVKEIEGNLNSVDLKGLSEKKIDSLRSHWEGQLNELETHHRESLFKARDMLAALSESLRSSDGEEPAIAMEALEQRMMSLEEEADENFEMVQLGLAVAIINHEFASAIGNVRKSIQHLGAVSQRNAPLKAVYEAIRQNFQHLDGHLKLFTPLQRRLYRTAQKIKGTDIKKYIIDLFGNRFERNKIEFECSAAFLSSVVECYPSNLYPAVINLVDNAIFWLGNKSSGKRILVDATATDIVVLNTGAPIEERDYLRIFERGFSRKPGGRGLGLYISLKALEEEGMGLRVADPPPQYSVAFHINCPTLALQ